MKWTSKLRTNRGCRATGTPCYQKATGLRLPRVSTVRMRVLATILGAFFLSGIAQAITPPPPPPPPPPPNLAPLIFDFKGINGATMWTFRGQVVDEHPAGLVVTFGGLLSGHQTSVQNADGHFYYSLQLQGPGMVTARTVDDQQKESNLAIYYVP